MVNKAKTAKAMKQFIPKRAKVATMGGMDLEIPNHSGIANHPEAKKTFVEVAGDTMTGALTLANVTNAITSGNYPIQMKSGVSDGATAIGHIFDTTNDLTTAGAEVAVWRNQGTDIMHIEKAGVVVHDKMAVGSDASLTGFFNVADTVATETSGLGATAAVFKITNTGVGVNAKPTVLTAQGVIQNTAVSGFGPIVKIINGVGTQDSDSDWSTTQTNSIVSGKIKVNSGKTGDLGEVAIFSSNTEYGNTTGTSPDMPGTGRPDVLYHYHVEDPGIILSGSENPMALTDAYGFYINEVTGFGVFGGAKTTNAYGLYINKQSRGTNNYGLVLNGDGVGADILFGAGQDASILYDNTNLVIDPKLVGTGYLQILGSLALDNGEEMRYYDVGSSNYVGFKAPALTANQIWTLPTVDGVSGDVLQTDGTGVLSWNENASEKAWTFTSPTGSSGTKYYGGFYILGATDNDFNPSITHGTTNSSYAAHLFLVQAAGASGGTDTIIRITGTSITDGGVRTTSDTEDLTVDNAGTANTYYETTKKWLGQVTIAKQSGPDLLCNYGFCKYWDNNNTDFQIGGVDATWLAGANDANPNLRVIHHKSTGWTYNAGAEATPPSDIASMNADHGVESELINGEEGAWKKTGINHNIMGSTNEGIIIEVVTTANKAFELGNILIRITPQ